MKSRLLSFALLVLPMTVNLQRCGFPNIHFTPSSLTFAPRVVDPSGSASAVQTVTVSNTGNKAGAIGPFTTSSSYALTTNCPSSLAPGASCTIDFRFAPNQVGVIYGEVINGSRGGTVSLSSTGLAPVGLSPEILDFGTVVIGTASAAKKVTLTNNQSSALAITSIAASGNYAQTNTCPASLAAGASCDINATFHPTANGAIPGALTVITDAALAAQPVALTGGGSGSTTPKVSFSPSHLDFGNQPAGTSSASQTVTLANTSASSSLTVQNVAVSIGYSETNTCTSPLAPNGTCTISVTFNPTANLVPIAYAGAITVSDSDATGTQEVGLSGGGVAPVSAAPASLDFGVISGNPVVDPQTVTLTNVGSASQDVSVIAVQPLFPSNNTCTAAVPSGGTCSVDVTIGAGFSGQLNGAMTYHFSSGGFLDPQAVNISACRTPVGLVPTKLNFGAVSVGQTSANETVNIALDGMNFSGFTLSGKNAGDFVIASNTCISPLSGSCNVDLTFKPTSTGTRTSTLNIADDQACSPQPISLTGGSATGPFVLTSTVVGTGNGSVASSPAGIGCAISSVCSAGFASGTAVTLTATPGPDTRFVGWSGACSGTSTCALTMTADRQVTATFAANPVLSVGVGTNATGSGSVTSSPAGIQCPNGSCQSAFAPGTVITLTAAPAAGSNFVGWSNGPCSGTGTCSITMNSDQHVDATFNGPPMLTVTEDGSGTGTVTSAPAGINCPGICQAGFAPGAVVTLSAAPSGNSTFGSWGGACSGIGACSVTMTVDQSVNATFNGPPDFTVSIDPPIPPTITAGSSATFTLSLNAMNGFSSPVSVACVSSSPAQGVSCKLSSASIQAGTPGTLTVSTLGRSAALSPSALRWANPVYAAWLPLFGLSLMGVAGTRRKLSRSNLLLLIFGVLLGLVVMQTACGGGSSPGSSGTPPGSYTVKINETAGTTKHSSTVTVNVR